MLSLLLITSLLASTSFADEAVTPEPPHKEEAPIVPEVPAVPEVPLEPPHYNAKTFLENIHLRPQFVDFYAPWCAHCKTMTPAWTKLYRVFGGIGTENDEHKEPTVDVGIAKVDCTKNAELCADQHITGYPTLKFFKINDTEGIRYKSSRGYLELSIFVKKQMGLIEETPEEKAKREKALLDAQEYTVDNFNRIVSKGHHFIEFFAPWCSHCQRMRPSWDKLANEYHSAGGKVMIATVDCTQYKALCNTYNIRGYPTLLWFLNGKLMEYRYDGDRSYDDLKKFIEANLLLHDPATVAATEALKAAALDDDDLEIPGEGEKKKIENVLMKEETTTEPLTTPSAVRTVTKENFHSTVDTGISVLKYVAPWCGHCKDFAGDYEEIAKKYKDQIILGEVDCMEERDLCEEQGITGFPTIKVYRGGSPAENYEGDRTLEEMTKFITSLVREEL